MGLEGQRILINISKALDNVQGECVILKREQNIIRRELIEFSTDLLKDYSKRIFLNG